MTKTTNFAISKKLAEIGFKAETSTSMSMLETKDYPSYDLETLLYNLPEAIRNNEELNLTKKEIGYFFWDSNEIFCSIGVAKQKNESFADTVGRLIILLHEKNLIKF